jgi:hypothetical protein
MARCRYAVSVGRKPRRRRGRRGHLVGEFAPKARLPGVGELSELRASWAWVEVPLGDEESWWVAALFTRREDRAAIVELRVFPGEDRDDPDAAPEIGEWSRTANGLTDLPPGGITARLLRDISVSDLEQTLQEALHESSTHPVLRAIARDVDAHSERPGRRGRPDLHYARWAARYVDALRHSSTPNAHLADEAGLRPEQVRDAIHEARARGLLTKTGRGRAGGQLTTKAVNLLAEQERKRPKNKKGKP